MAAPVTLTAWRAFIDRPDPRPPARLTRAAMRRLSTTAKDVYDRDRLAWLGADVVFGDAGLLGDRADAGGTVAVAEEQSGASPQVRA